MQNVGCSDVSHPASIPRLRALWPSYKPTGASRLCATACRAGLPATC